MGESLLIKIIHTVDIINIKHNLEKIKKVVKSWETQEKNNIILKKFFEVKKLWKQFFLEKHLCKLFTNLCNFHIFKKGVTLSIT